MGQAAGLGRPQELAPMPRESPISARTEHIARYANRGSSFLPITLIEITAQRHNKLTSVRDQEWQERREAIVSQEWCQAWKS
jgi:hypothetical protein